MNDRRSRRLICLLAIVSLLFVIAGIRLALLQFGFERAKPAGASLLHGAAAQRTDELVVDGGRGRFLDRKGRMLTDIPIDTLAAFPDYGMPRGTAFAVRRVADALSAFPGDLEAWLRKMKAPDVWREPLSGHPLGLNAEQAKAVREAGLLGVAVLPYRDRYTDDVPPIHAIGYISQDPQTLRRLYPAQTADGSLRATGKIGGAGLERSLERFLRSRGPVVVRQPTDAARRPLAGLGLRTAAPDNPHYPLAVRTTLDLDMQSQTERVLLDGGVRRGAAVVLDAENGDVLAMVSLPRLDPGRIGAPATDARNHAVTAYPPGSVFKTVTLAAALESGEAGLRQPFRCEGEYPRYGLKCWKPGGHGRLTLKEAYAESCNVVFASLGERLDPAWIQITGERLGLGRQVGWHTDSFVDGKPLRLLIEEEPGAIFRDKRSAGDGGVRTGTAIGQRDVRVTPLQAANLVVTLLHGGKVTAPRLVTEIRYADGGLLADLPVQSSPSRYGTVSPDTAYAVLEAMRSVVTDGTAREALASSAWPLSGKSGTAELAGAQKARNDHWFVGYGPAKGKPRYAVAVLIEDQPAGLRNRAAAVFGNIMERVRLLDERGRARPAAGVPAARS